MTLATRSTLLERATEATARQLSTMIRDAIRCDLDARDARLDLLAIGTDSKTVKGEGITTGILYLTAGNLCPWADSCRAACLITAGRGSFESVQHGRARKTALFHRNRDLFWLLFERDVRKVERAADRTNTVPAVRGNGTSDLPFERFAEWRAIASAHGHVRFYDYTKAPYSVRPAGALPGNYDLTASRGASWLPSDVHAMLRNGRRVAVVFSARAYEYVMERGEAWGAPVVDGDSSDYRPADPVAIVALKAKGAAKHDDTGFVVRLEDLLFFASNRD